MGTNFETTTCGRCGGSGKYSYNQIDGDRCYGCGGTGIVLSKRGSKARARFFESLTKPVSEAAAGMFCWERGKWRTILEIGPSTTKIGYTGPTGETVWHNTVQISLKIGGVSMPETTKIPFGTADEIKEKLDEALAYQNTLKK